MSHEINVSGVYDLLEELRALKKESSDKELVSNCQTTISSWFQPDIESKLFLKKEDTINSYIERLQDIISFIIHNSEKRKQRIDFVVNKISEICIMNIMMDNVNIFDTHTSIYYYIWPNLYSNSSPLQRAKDIYIKLEDCKNRLSYNTKNEPLVQEELASIIEYLDNEFHFCSTVLCNSKLTIASINAKLADRDSEILKVNKNDYLLYSTINTDELSTDTEVFVHELSHLLIDKLTGDMFDIEILKPFYKDFYKPEATDDLLAELFPNLMCAGFLVDSKYGEHLPYEMSQDDARYLKKVNQALIKLYKTFQEPSLIKRKISDIFEDNSCEP